MGRQSRMRAERRAAKAASPKKPYVVAGRVEIPFDGAEWRALMEFQSVINSYGTPMSIEQLCKQSIFWAISESFKRGQELAEKEKGNGVTSDRDTTGDTSPASASQATSADMVASTQASGDTSPTGT